MPPLIRHDTNDSPRYYLDGTPLETRNVIEVWSSGQCVLVGFFAPIDRGDVFVKNDCRGSRLSPDADFRRYIPERVEYVTPPMAAPLKDHERRTDYR